MEKRLENSQKYFYTSVPSFAAVNQFVSGPMISTISHVLILVRMKVCAPLKVSMREYSGLVHITVTVKVTVLTIGCSSLSYIISQARTFMLLIGCDKN